LAKRVCIFCGGKPVTKEHYLGKAFIERVLGGDKTSRYGFHHDVWTAKTETREQKQWVVARPDMTATCACDPCNSVWMNQARLRIEPLIEPMIYGHQPTRINKLDDIAALAAWMTQVGICAAYLSSDVPKTLGPAFYESRTPPADHRIRLAVAEIQETHLEVATNVVQLFTAPVSDPARVEGYCVTVRIKHLVFQVLCPPAGYEAEIESKVEWESRTIPVWPLTFESVTWPWPPPQPLDLIDFHFLTQAYFEPVPPTTRPVTHRRLPPAKG
jgi:hypothetical protein